MKSNGSAHRRAAILLGVMVVASLLSAAFWPAAAQPAAPASTGPVFESQEAWRTFMAQLPLPLKGCFTATYPHTTWQQVPCTAAPRLPFPPARGPRPATVGAGTDLSAVTTGNTHISSAVGSFVSVSGVKSETGYVDGNPPLTANAFTLQLNTNFISGDAACNGAKTPADCLAWQQFVLSNVSCGCAFMQYWLIDYNTSCPAGWIAYKSDCYVSTNGVIVPTQKIANLVNMSMTGLAVSGGNDTLILSTGSQLYMVTNKDSVINLALAWQAAEFNIFGDCCGVEAYFNNDSTIVVGTRVNDGSPTTPSCVQEGFTAETNNLTLVENCFVSKPGMPPEIMFTESNASRVPMMANSPTASSQ